MHQSRRLIFSLLCGVALISGIFALYQANSEVKALKNQVRQEATLVAESQRNAVEQALESGSTQELQALAAHSQGMAVFDMRGMPLAMASGLNAAAAEPAVTQALASGMAVGEFVKINGESAYVYVLPLAGDGAIAMIRETAWITAPIWRHGLASAAQTLLIVGITLLIVGWSLSKPLRGIAQWLRESRTGDAHTAAELPKDGIFLSLSNEVAQHRHQSARGAGGGRRRSAPARRRPLPLDRRKRLRIAMQGQAGRQPPVRRFQSRTL